MNPEKRPLNWKDLSTSRKVQLGGITLLVALGGADVTTTYLGLHQGFSEGFPLARHLMDNFGVLGGIVGLDSAAIVSLTGASEVYIAWEIPIYQKSLALQAQI